MSRLVLSDSRIQSRLVTALAEAGITFPPGFSMHELMTRVTNELRCERLVVVEREDSAIMRYAGTGERAFKRLKKTSRLVSNPKAGSLFETYIKKLSEE